MRKAALLSLLVLVACARGSAPALTAHGPAFAISEKTLARLAPIALDANDGTAMKVRDLQITVTTHGPIAHTSVYAAFQNPFAGDIEGRFRMVMPPRSSISRLAMKIYGEWREAEVAETFAARQTYETILHRKRDPLLIEQPHEREIAARIAPVFGHEVKEVRLEYTSEVGPDRPIVVPLRGLPVVDHLEVSIVDGATEPVHVDTRDQQPAADVRYELPPSVPSTVRSGDFVAMRLEAGVPAEPWPLAHVVYLVDTSASADLEAAISLLEALPKGPMIAYDQTAAYVQTASELRARGALGLARLEKGFELARQSGAKRIVVLGGGSVEGAERPAGVERVDVLGTTATVDARSLRKLAYQGAIVEDAPLLSRAALVRRLEHRVQDAPIAVQGATWQSSSRLLAASPGEERVVYARVPSVVDDVNDPAVDHAVAAAKVEALLAGPLTDATKKEVIRLAHQHRLSTPFTSLIVLENDSDVASLHANEPHANDSPPAARAPAPPAKGLHGHVTKAVAMRAASTIVSGRLPPETIQRVVRLNTGVFQACYNAGLRRDPRLAGRVVVKFIIQRDGTVERAIDGGSEITDKVAIDCVVQAFRRLVFPVPEGGIVTVVYPFLFSHDPPEEPRPVRMDVVHHRWSPFKDAFEPRPVPWSDAYAQMREDPSLAPRTPFGFVALGESLETKGEKERAARAYASLAELWPERTELARAAAVRLDHVRPGDPLAIALLRRAVAERPDQPSGHHLLGLTLLRAGDREGARAAFEAGAERRYELRYAGVADLFKADLALLEPSNDPLTRLSLAWETDTSDLDVSVTNPEGEPRPLASIADASDGYGPEAGNVVATEDVSRVRVTLHRRGMGGDVLGAVHVIKRSARGELTIEPRPFEIMNERSSIDLGRD